MSNLCFSGSGGGSASCSAKDTAPQVVVRIRAPSFHTPGTGLVWLENTHNMSGGRVTPLEEMRRIAEECRQRAIPVHLDGARIFNAAAALGVPAVALAACADSVSFCLSKGLGAPVGSLLCGDERFRRAAHRLRKMLGGGMRQAGVLAAAGRWALENNVTRLTEDHDHARRLAAGLAGAPGLLVDPAPQTNIVMAEATGASAEELSARAGAEGVLFLALGPRKIRFVTHLDVDGAGIDRAVAVVRAVLGGALA